MASTSSEHHLERSHRPVGDFDAHSATATLAAAVDPLLEASENWMQRLRELTRTADSFVRENPWQAMGAVALVGMTVGYLLARRT